MQITDVRIRKVEKEGKMKAGTVHIRAGQLDFGGRHTRSNHRPRHIPTGGGQAGPARPRSRPV